MIDQPLTTEMRLRRLLQELGIERAHWVGSAAQDYRGILRMYPELLASLTLVSPGNLDADTVRPLAERLLLIHGDRGPGSQVVPRAMSRLPDARMLTLAGHVDASWSDVVADRVEEIAGALETHVHRHALPAPHTPGRPEGVIAGIHYRAIGSGQPVVFLPLGLAPSQWEPLIEPLRERFCLIILGGPELGMVAQLEERAQSIWYQGMLRDLLAAAKPSPGERILEVGCGGGTVVRHLARWTSGNPIMGVDINRYLLREAEQITRTAGLAERIELREGNAEALPLSDGEFDVTFCVTVMEEGDADQMLRELVRVTRTGGRVATMVRSVDIPWWINVAVPEVIKAKAVAVAGAGVAEHGCADASLGRKMVAAGLHDVDLCPRYATIESGSRMETALARIRSLLSPEESQVWDAAVEDGRQEGSLFIAQPYYCAIGGKP